MPECRICLTDHSEIAKHVQFKHGLSAAEYIELFPAVPEAHTPATRKRRAAALERIYRDKMVIGRA